VFYPDPWAALDWLQKAFGFQRSMVISDKDGKLGHAEMRFGDSIVYAGAEWAEFVASPVSVRGKNTQTIQGHLKDGLDAHWARGHAAGAVILQDRTYRARSGRPCLDVRPDRPSRVARGGREGQWAQDRRAKLAMTSANRSVPGTSADPVRPVIDRRQKARGLSAPAAG
jgi:uncharacterized glyoxalase superfamily protein PhnB